MIKRRGLDANTPNVARIYDYWLGGKDNFAADRTTAEKLCEIVPEARATARDNREFLGRAVRFLAEAGIRQFIDLGTGLPTQANVHELAQGVAPEARMVYVDIDPVVASHGRALLASGDQVGMVLGDLCDPASILQHPDVTCRLDLSRPAAVLCTSTLHFIGDDADPHKVIAEYRDHLAPGSYLAISHGTLEEDPAGEGGKAEGVYRQASSQLHVRPIPEVLRFFDGFGLVDPGLTWITGWRPEPGTAPTGRPRSMRGGVGRKP
jgi:SAM-dependent methyltransferase